MEVTQDSLKTKGSTRNQIATWPRWLPLLLVLAGILAYANTFSAPFILDDVGSISENLQIRRLWPLWEALKAPLNSPVAGRPIVSLSFAVNYAIDGLNPRGYHVFNLAVHLASALLLFEIVRRTLVSSVFAGRFERDAPWLAVATAVLWMLHPLQTEAVTYVTQRTELLMGLFFFLTLYCAIRGWQGGRRWGWFLGAIVSCALGMGSKEVMVSAPVLVLLYDRTFVSGSFRSALRRSGALYACLAATWVIVGAGIAAGARAETVGFDLQISPMTYLRTQAGVVLWYLRLCIWPDPLVISYDDWPRAESLLHVLPQVLAIAMLLAATVLALWRRPVFGFLGAWFFLILAPSSSVVPIVTEIAAERRMYLPLAALVTLATVGGYLLLKRLVDHRRMSPAVFHRIVGGAAVAAAVLLGWATVSRNHDYRSELAIWRDTVTKRPGNALAQAELGDALADVGRYDEASECFTRAVTLRPRFAEAYGDWANAMADQGRHSQALEYFNKALQLDPRAGHVRNNLGTMLQAMGRYEQAVAQFTEALAIRKDFPDAHCNLGSALMSLGRFDEARAHLEEAVRLKRDFPEAHNNLGLLFAQNGEAARATEHLMTAIRLRPGFPEAHNNLGLVLAEQGRLDEAVKQFREALRLRPDYVRAQANLANVISNQRNGLR